MNHIVNPSIFYWISTLATLKAVLTFIIAIGGIAIGLLLIVWLVVSAEEVADSEVKQIRKITFRGVCLYIILMILYIFTPDKNTMYAMLIADTVTTENIDYAEEKLESIIDATIEKINEIDNE